MNKLPHKQFTSGTDILDAHFLEKTPLLRAACYPRRILPPTNYLNPRHYGACLAANYRLWLRPDATGLAHTTSMMTALLLTKYMVPTYFVEGEFAEAVAQTEPPDDFYLRDIKWPLPAMVFVLPDAFVQKYFGWYIPFISVAKATAGTYPPDAKPYPKTEFDLEWGSLLPVESDRILLHYSIFSSKTAPVDYAGNYPLNAPLSVIETAKFENATTYEEELYTQIMGNRLQFFADLNFTPEQDRAIQIKVITFAIKLLLALTARPEYIVTNNKTARPAKTGKRAQDALYHPNIIGAKYRVLRPTGMPTGEGSGKKMPMHWHPGYMKYIAHGSRTDFVSINALPRTPEKKIDWVNTPKDVLDRFHACHRFDWIDAYLVNAPKEYEKTTA